MTIEQKKAVRELIKKLSVFCGSDPRGRFDCERPFVADGKYIGTNGHILAFVATTEPDSSIVGLSYPPITKILKSASRIKTVNEWPHQLIGIQICNLGHEHASTSPDYYVKLGKSYFRKNYLDLIVRNVSGPLRYGTNKDSLVAVNDCGWTVILMCCERD